MATVTKMKAAVNNKNLPILDSDGNLRNYYVGRYLNKMSDIGVSIDNAEVSALNAFIESGISDGWIDDILYFMPFIGKESNPLSGMVPLIDNIANYELTGDSVSNKLFTFNSGKIVSLGNVENNSNVYWQLPIKNTDMENGVSVFFNKTANANDNAGYITCSYIPDSKIIMGVRKHLQSQCFQWALRATDSQQEPSVSNIAGSDYTSGEQIGVFMARYVNSSNEQKLKRYVIKKGSSSPVSNDMTGNTDSDAFSTTRLNMNISYPSGSKLTTTYNCLAFINPISISVSKIYSFNQAVFALTTALGR